MDNAVRSIAKTFFQQQKELNLPDYIISENSQNTTTSATNTPIKQATTKTDTENNQERYDRKRAALVELFKEVNNCSGCILKNSRHKMVFGAGWADAQLMIIGEAPGRDEDRQGLPFVGEAGQLLTKMLQAINLDRGKDVFITNILKCRPPGNRNPNNEEILACTPILRRQIQIIKPKVILLLGRIAAHELLGKSESIAALRILSHSYSEIPTIITYHPAALLRNKQYKHPTWVDLQKVRDLLRKKEL